MVVAPTASVLAVGVTLGAHGRAIWLGFAVAVAILVVSFLALRREPFLLVAALTLWLSIERIAVAIVSPSLDGESLRALLIYKELFFPLLGVILLPQLTVRWSEAEPAVRLVDSLAIAFCALVLIDLVIGSAPLMDRLVYARRLALLPLAYAVVRLMPWRPSSLRMTIGLIVTAGFMLAVFGLAERFLIEQIVWRQAVPAAYYYHLSSVAGLTASGTDFPVGGLPVIFFDFTSGVAERRLVSTFLEATTLASFLAFAAIISIAAYRPSRASIAVTSVVAAATVLTQSKAGWALMAAGIGYVVAVSFVPRLRDPAWLLSLAAGLIGALLVVAIGLSASGDTTGALAHFRGLEEGISSAMHAPMGVGLGYGGNFGTTTTGAESTFGVMLVQVGIPGFAIWSLWIIGTALLCAKVGARVPGNWMLGPATAAALIAFFATASMTESAGGLLGNWVYPLLAGALVTTSASTARGTGYPARFPGTQE